MVQVRSAWRLRSFWQVCAAAALLLVTAGPSADAQGQGTGLYDVLVPRVAPQRPPARILNLPRNSARAPVRRVLDPAIPSPLTAASDSVIARPKADIDTFVVVLGDTLGELLANGVDDALKDVPNAAVIRRTRADSGLVRTDFYDWAKAARELLASDQRVSVAIMLLGANDRQPIREGDIVHEPLSERWRELYRERIDAVAQAFSERRVPLIWVGAPPMQNARLSADMIALNDMYRQRVERLGAVYVDLWPGFVDGENRYSATGPDLSGQIARLRTNDGVHFTRSGARKAAHFADIALRRILPEIAAGPVLAAPGPVALPIPAPAVAVDTVPLPIEVQPGSIDRMIDQMARLGSGLEPFAVPDIKVKPVAGPVLPLTGPSVSAGGALLPGIAASRGVGEQANEINRVFTEGRAPVATPGRADDFRWPRP